MTEHDDRLKRMLDDAAADAEAGRDDDGPLPDHVTVTRGRADSRVLQVRLNPDEYEALERLATARGLPVSTIARAQLLKLMQENAVDDGRTHLSDAQARADGAQERADESRHSSADAHREAADVSEAAARLYDRLEDETSSARHRDAAARHRRAADADDG